MRAALLLAFGLVGCGGALNVHHLDPTHPVARVQVDDGPAQTLRYGERLRVRVAPGPHLITLHPPEGPAPWTDGARPLVLYVDAEAELTLLPPEGAP